MNLSKTLMQRMQTVLIELGEDYDLPIDTRLDALKLLTELRKSNPPAKRKRAPKIGTGSGLLGTR